MGALYMDYIIRCTLRAHVDSFPLAMAFDFASNDVTPSGADVENAATFVALWASTTYSEVCTDGVEFDAVEGQAMSGPGGYEYNAIMTGIAGNLNEAEEVLPYAVDVAVSSVYSGYGRHGRKYTFGAPVSRTVNRNQWSAAWRDEIEDAFLDLAVEAEGAGLPWVVASFTRNLITPITVIRAMPNISVLGRRLKRNT